MVYSVDMELRGLRGTKGDEADKQGWTGTLFFHKGQGQNSMGLGGAGREPPPRLPTMRGGKGRAGNILCVSAD